jgi:serine/threonine protein kinase
VEPLFVSESELPHAATRKLVIGLLNKNAIQRRTVAEMLNGSFLSGNLHTSHIKPREKVSVEEPRIITRFNPELYNLDPEHRVNHGIELNAKISTNQLACYWKAWDNDNARYPVVCKFYFRAPRFDREQMAVQKLPPHRHIILPKVMRLIDASANKRDPWYPYKIAALMYDDTPTTTLYDTMLQHPQRFQSKDRFAVLQSMVNALEVVHGLGLVHCNVHPRNIIFSDNRWQLGGFSSCRPKGEVMDELEFPYSPPELWTARSLPVNETFDMYALGVLLFHLKVFRTRYFENEWEEIWEYQTNVAVLNKLKGGRTRDVIMKLVTYDPTKRMTLQQLKQDLETRPASLPLWKRF